MSFDAIKLVIARCYKVGRTVSCQRTKWPAADFIHRSGVVAHPACVCVVSMEASVYSKMKVVWCECMCVYLDRKRLVPRPPLDPESI